VIFAGHPVGLRPVWFKCFLNKLALRFLAPEYISWKPGQNQNFPELEYWLAFPVLFVCLKFYTFCISLYKVFCVQCHNFCKIVLYPSFRYKELRIQPATTVNAAIQPAPVLPVPVELAALVRHVHAAVHPATNQLRQAIQACLSFSPSTDFFSCILDIGGKTPREIRLT
jgi:hypothetical protein